MCSIFGIFGLQPGDDLPALRRAALDALEALPGLYLALLERLLG